MAFRQVNFAHLVKFNSDSAFKLLSAYENQILSDIREGCAKPKSRTFAPSCMRCDRKSWFRLRGVQPDIISDPDPVLDHTAYIGTALHERIQSALEKSLGEDWIDVEQYINEHPIGYACEFTKNGHETQIYIPDIPIKFACDGIVRINDKYYLLEIKSSEYDSWNALTEPKPHHMDQVKTYSTILNLPNVLMLYIDRQFGYVKSYEKSILTLDIMNTKDRFVYVKDMVEKNLAPEHLPQNDYMCTNCEYKLKCKEW